MKNPYVRLRELCGLTQKAFAERNGFGKMTMVYLEAGIYPKISERQNIALGKECAERHVNAREILLEEYGVESLLVAYSKWRSQARKSAPERAEFPQPPFRSTEQLSPMHFFVKGMTGSMQRFAKVLKVPPVTIMRYVRGETMTMPKELETAFEEMGYGFIEELRKAQMKWVQETL